MYCFVCIILSLVVVVLDYQGLHTKPQYLVNTVDVSLCMSRSIKIIDLRVYTC